MVLSQRKPGSAMSLLQTVSYIKDEALNSVVCPIVMRLGIHTMPAASLLIGEVTLTLWHYPPFANKRWTDGIPGENDLYSRVQENRSLEAIWCLQTAVLCPSKLIIDKFGCPLLQLGRGLPSPVNGAGLFFFYNKRKECEA